MRVGQMYYFLEVLKKREREREKRESKKLLKRKELSMMGIPSWLSWPYLQDSIW